MPDDAAAAGGTAAEMGADGRPMSEHTDASAEAADFAAEVTASEADAAAHMATATAEAAAAMDASGHAVGNEDHSGCDCDCDCDCNDDVRICSSNSLFIGDSSY